MGDRNREPGVINHHHPIEEENDENSMENKKKFQTIVGACLSNRSASKRLR